jgi:hypothetical protein
MFGEPIQSTIDAHSVYARRWARFGSTIDYSMLVKVYGESNEPEKAI